MLEWEALEQKCLACRGCPLADTRRHVVFGEGNRHARIVFIGEGPGQQEDEQGKPFVGKAGQLLTKMLGAIGLSREEVYIANIVKCRPPGNRVPTAIETDACLDYLRNQVMLIHPRIIVCLGATAARAIIHDQFRITSQHGQWYKRKDFAMMATYHPAALLRDQTKKQEAWQDLQKIRQALDTLVN